MRHRNWCYLLRSARRVETTRVSVLLIVPALALLACVFGSAAQAAVPAPDVKPVTVQWTQPVSVEFFLQKLQQYARLNMVVGNAQDLSQKMLQTVNFVARPPGEIVKEICATEQINCQYNEATDTWYINQENLTLPTDPSSPDNANTPQSQPGNLLASASGAQAGANQGNQANVIDTASVDRRRRSDFVEEMVPLKYMDCRQIVDLIQNHNIESLTNPFTVLPFNAFIDSSASPYAGVAPADTRPPASTSEMAEKFLTNLMKKQGASGIPAAGGNSYSGPTNGVAPPGDNNFGFHNSARSGDSFAQFPGFGGPPQPPGGGFGGGRFGGGGGRFGGGRFGGGGGQFGNPGGAFNGINGGAGGPGGANGQGAGPFGALQLQTPLTSLTDLFPTGTELIPYPPSNSIIVISTPASMDFIRNLIAQFDIKPQFILIQVVKLIVDDSDSKAVGLDYHLATPLVTIDTHTQGSTSQSGTIGISYLGNNVSATLSALESSSHNKVVARPRVILPNGVFGYVQDETVTPIVLPGVTGGFGSQNVPPTVTEGPPSGFTFGFIPRLNGDGTITIYSVISDSTTGPTISSFGITVPSFQNQVHIPVPGIRVVNGDTIALGGFSTETLGQTAGKVPVLGDLPIIGGLFRSTNNTDTRDLVLYFITPNIVDDHGQIIPGGADAVRTALGETQFTSAVTLPGSIPGTGGAGGVGGLPPVGAAGGALPNPAAIGPGF